MNDRHEKSLEKIQREIANIPQDVLDAFLRRYERHSFSARLDAHHAIRNTFFRPKLIYSCKHTDILVISGRDNVDGTGRMILPIKHCEDYHIIREPNFVATPHGSKPSFITTTSSSTIATIPGSAGLNYLDDVSVEVMAWRGDGSPAGGIEFSWICTVEVIKILGG